MAKLDKEFLEGSFYSGRLSENEKHLHLYHQISSQDREFHICIYCGKIIQKNIKQEIKIYIDEDKMWEY